MSFFEELELVVREFAVEGVSVRDYRLSLMETLTAELGVESNRLGSPYAPLAVTEITGGSFLLQWSDGLVSRGSVTRAPRSAVRDVLRAACAGRYEDEDAAVFPGASEVPEVVLRSGEAAAVATGERPSALPETVQALQEEQRARGAALLDASAGAALTTGTVASSGGFRARWEATTTSFSLALDSLVWDGHTRRTAPGPEEVRRLAALTGEDYASLRETAPGEVEGACEIVLHPRVAEQFLRTFLLSNLSGAAVANDRGRFGAEDFRSGRRVFREDLSVGTRPLEDLGPGSFVCTSEGVPAREVTLVRSGCLVTPALGLKHARKLGLEPAPTPSAIDGYRFEMGRRLSREEALSGKKAVLVHSVLGMHTQDPVRGEYSLLCPQGALYAGGRGLGRVAFTLSGSFFEDLGSRETALVDFPGFAGPGLRLARVVG